MANYLLTSAQKDKLPIIEYEENVLANDITLGDNIFWQTVENGKNYYLEAFFRVQNTTNCSDGFKVSLASGTVSGEVFTIMYKYNSGAYDVSNNYISVGSKETYTVDLTTVNHVFIKIEGFIKTDDTSFKIIVYPVTNGQTCTVSQSVCNLIKLD
jgi:hypothetical protein